ncbi:hypothetical protein ACIQGZ_24355 [Streptomyces sp. NPDC092296]|uniref:hypothetical protein n=1 Tax=Streptomyces sp. NPDC092296 TaxID=3366012 RepID=UPI0038048120
MITSSPVARWTWNSGSTTGDEITDCVGAALSVLYVLVANRLSGPVRRISVEVGRYGAPQSPLHHGVFELRGNSLEENARRIVDEVRAAAARGPIGSVVSRLACPGRWYDADGAEHREARMFDCGALATDSFVAVDLATYGGCWTPYDLTGRPQPTVHQANAPRLAAALNGLAALLRDPTEPDGPTRFGVPTPTGVANLFGPDGTADDVWSRFEQPATVTA